MMWLREHAFYSLSSRSFTFALCTFVNISTRQLYLLVLFGVPFDPAPYRQPPSSPNASAGPEYDNIQIVLNAIKYDY